MSLSLPWRMIVLPMMPTPLPGCGPPEARERLVQQELVDALASWPPYSFGQVIPSQPCVGQLPHEGALGRRLDGLREVLGVAIHHVAATGWPRGTPRPPSRRLCSSSESSKSIPGTSALRRLAALRGNNDTRPSCNKSSPGRKPCSGRNTGSPRRRSRLSGVVPEACRQACACPPASGRYPGPCLVVGPDGLVGQDQERSSRSPAHRDLGELLGLDHAVDPRDAAVFHARRHVRSHGLRAERRDLDSPIAVGDREPLGEGHRRMLRHRIGRRSDLREQTRCRAGIEQIALARARASTGSTAWAAWTCAITLMSQILFQASTATSGPPSIAMPAFETKRSIGPASRSTSATRASIAVALETSSPRAVPPIRRPPQSRLSSSRSTTVICARPLCRKALTERATDAVAAARHDDILAGRVPRVPFLSAAHDGRHHRGPAAERFSHRRPL